MEDSEHTETVEGQGIDPISPLPCVPCFPWSTNWSTSMDFSEYSIHILPGDSAAGTWNMVFGAKDRLLVHRDDLTCGPLRTFHSLSTWTALRQDFWNTVNP